MDRIQLSIVIPATMKRILFLNSLNGFIVRWRESPHLWSLVLLMMAVQTKLGSNRGCDKKYPTLIKGIRFRRNYGKSAALNSGFHDSRGDVVITMDADLQDSPEEIPELYRMIHEEGYDLVSGWKRNDMTTHLQRTCPPNYTMLSQVGWVEFLFMIWTVASRHIGVMSYVRSKSMAKCTDIYLLLQNGRDSGILVKSSITRARKYGYSKFGLSRFTMDFDLATIMFIGKFGKRPMHFLERVLFFLPDFVLWAILSSPKYAYNIFGMTDRPAFYISLVRWLLVLSFF